jgi:large subunit ribosomal protein L9
MQNKLLLLEDVQNLGRSGDLVSVKPGYARNFLIPQKKAVIAGKMALRMQERLIEERKKQAAIDLVEAQALVARLEGVEFSVEAKADAEGKLYGSVSAADLVKIFEKEGLTIEKNQVILVHPIKSVGVYTIPLKLKEGVSSSISLKVKSDKPVHGAPVEGA